MKIKDGFLMQDVAGSTVILPMVGDLDRMITLNDTGKFLWEHLEKETTAQALADALLQEYDVDPATAVLAVEQFVARLKEHGFLA